MSDFEGKKKKIDFEKSYLFVAEFDIFSVESFLSKKIKNASSVIPRFMKNTFVVDATNIRLVDSHAATSKLDRFRQV
jgi:hypothetical protein